MKKINMPRLIVYSDTVCNLRCVACHEYILQTSNMPRYSVSKIKKSLYEYFQIADHVKMVTITGGEPFLNSNSADLMEYMKNFIVQYDKLEIMTNGTLLPSGQLLAICADNPKSVVFINHYGALSSKADEIAGLCEKMNIRYVVRKYHGEDAHMGGWFDLFMLSGDNLNDESKIKARFSKCLTGNNPRLGLSFGLFEDRLFACSAAGIAHRLGVINSSDAYVDMCDDNISFEQKLKQIEKLRDSEYLPACAVCHGNFEGNPHFTPAVQYV